MTKPLIAGDATAIRTIVGPTYLEAQLSKTNYARMPRTPDAEERSLFDRTPDAQEKFVSTDPDTAKINGFAPKLFDAVSE